jgi:hypothetical protein
MNRLAVLTLALLFALSIILSACGSSAEANPPPAPPQEQPETQPEAAVTEAYPQPAAELINPASPYPGPGGDVSNYTTWGKAAEAILGGQVKEIFASADGHVTLVLQDGSVKLVLEKPAGELAKLLETCGDPCKAIKINR